MKNPFIKYVMKEKKENIFHSSEYGKAQSASNMGVTSAESFEKRMKVEQDRKIVRGYNDSRVMSGAYMNGPRAKKYVPEKKKEQMKGGSGTKAVMPESAPASRPMKRSFMPLIKPKFGK